jgi:hypothetical protein
MSTNYENDHYGGSGGSHGDVQSGWRCYDSNDSCNVKGELINSNIKSGSHCHT